MKYLVVKGWLGFGDRLESLKMAVKFAIENDLKIYVDWTDSIWSHGTESFYTYFKLVNIPVLEKLEDIPEGSTFYPEFWKDNLKVPISNELIGAHPELNLGILDNKVSEKTNADVLVYSSIGYRMIYPDSTFFANVFRVVDPRIIHSVTTRYSRYSLGTSIGIHLRGTDRVRNQIQREQKIQWLAVSAIQSGAFNGKQMVGVSDDINSLRLWRNFFPHTIILSELSLQTSSSKGNHNASKDEIQSSKDSLNVDMLIDFFTLALCENILTTYRDSRFTQEARRLHPFALKILNGS
jgi:hypothetical protein